MELDCSGNDEPGRIIAIDYGRRRMGLAVSDPMRIIASPRGVISDRSPDMLLKQVCRIVKELEVTEIVIGLPCGLEGKSSPMAREVSAWGDRLAAETGIGVFYIDESLSSVEANRISRDLGSNRSSADDIAASLILREYLEQKS